MLGVIVKVEVEVRVMVRGLRRLFLWGLGQGFDSFFLVLGVLDEWRGRFEMFCGGGVGGLGWIGRR